MKIFATKKAIQELVSEILENPPGLGWQSTGDLSTSPVSVSAVVDPSAALTDPGNEKFKPTDRQELKAALNMLASQVPDDKVSDFYSVVQDEVQDYENDEEDMAKNEKVEESIRKAIRGMIKESKKTSFSSLGEFWQNQLNEATPKREFPRNPATGKRYSAKNPFDWKASAVSSEEKPEVKKVAPGVSGRASMQPPTEEKLAELRKILDNFNVGEADKSTLLNIKSEKRAEEAILEALDEIPDSDAVNFTDIFNETKATLLDLIAEDSESSETPSKTGADEELELKGKKTAEGEKKLTSKQQKKLNDVIEDAIQYLKLGANGDSFITSSQLFEHDFKESFGKSFQDYCLSLGVKTRQSLAAAAAEDEKRGYTTDAEETLATAAEKLGPDPKSGKIWSSSQVNKISQIVLGKFTLALKCLSLGLELDIEEEMDLEGSVKDLESKAAPEKAPTPSVSTGGGAEMAIGDMLDAVEEDEDAFKAALDAYIMAVFPKEATNTSEGLYPSGAEFISSPAYKTEFGNLNSLRAGLVGATEAELERTVDAKIESGLSRYRRG